MGCMPKHRSLWFGFKKKKWRVLNNLFAKKKLRTVRTIGVCAFSKTFRALSRIGSRVTRLNHFPVARVWRFLQRCGWGIWFVTVHSVTFQENWYLIFELCLKVSVRWFLSKTPTVCQENTGNRKGSFISETYFRMCHSRSHNFGPEA